MSDACNRCTGHCCKAFTLPASPAQLAARRDRALRTLRRWEDPTSRDMLQIYDMVRLVRYGPFGDDYTAPDQSASEYWYTCTNLGADGNCTIYDKRPQMCRRYPDIGACSYVHCTWDKVKVPQDRQAARRALYEACERWEKREPA